MIFVTVGTQKFQFNRLLKGIDDWMKDYAVEYKVFAQIGYSDYRPKNFSYVDFLSTSEFENYIKNCSLVFTHSGVGSIMAALRYGKKTIVIPRIAAYKEHVDDHQLEIAETFSALNYVEVCTQLNDLSSLIQKVYEREFEKFQEKDCKNIESIIEDFLGL